MAIEAEERRSEPVPARTASMARLLRLLPAAAFLATFGLFFVDKNREARTVFGSGRGLLTVGVIVVGYVAVAVVLRRLVRGMWLAPVALAVVVLGLAAWIVRPYYVDETANRELVTGPVRDNAESAPAAEATGEAPAREQAPQGPVRVAAAPLRGIDHDAEGNVSLVRTDAGAQVVRFEGFDIEGTPDPQVYLVAGKDVRRPGGTRLGRLPGNRGDILDIEVPDGIEAGDGWTVLVWCGSFSVPVANATLAAT